MPSEPSSRVNGDRPAFSALTDPSNSSSATPAPPAPIWFARVTIAARTTIAGNGSPAPHAWLRSSRTEYCSRRFFGTR